MSQFVSLTVPGLEDLTAEELKKLGANVREIIRGAIIFNVENLKEISEKARGTFGIYELLAVAKHPEELQTDEKVQISLLESDFKYGEVRKYFKNVIKKADIGEGIIYGTDDILLLMKNMGFENLDSRPYLVFKHPAALNPVIAHLLVLFSRWNGQNIVDPFCGSGTILIEAALLRRTRIMGIDKNPKFVYGARKNVATAGVKVNCSVGSAEELHRFTDAEFIITNPPYGFRTGGKRETYTLYECFARELEEHFSGAEMTVITPIPKFEYYFHVEEKREIMHGKMKNKILKLKI